MEPGKEFFFSGGLNTGMNQPLNMQTKPNDLYLRFWGIHWYWDNRDASLDARRLAHMLGDPWRIFAPNMPFNFDIDLGNDWLLKVGQNGFKANVDTLRLQAFLADLSATPAEEHDPHRVQIAR